MQDTGHGRAIGVRADELDAERFVGRAAPMGRVLDALRGRSNVRIFHVHGPAGVGKSSFARAAARQAAEAGYRITALDGRVLPLDPDAFAAEVATAAGPGSLVVVDEVDEVVSLRFALRDALAASLDQSSVALLVGRKRPDRAWFDGGLEHVSDEITLRPLDADESKELLCRQGVTDPDDATAIARWARGFPLALTLATSLRRDPGADATDATTGYQELGSDLDLADTVLQRLVGGELEGIDLDVLDVAGVAAAIDLRLLEAALPGRSGATGIRQLRGLSTAERVGTRFTLHRLVQSAVRSRLRETDPDRYRTLVLRIAEHLRVRALTEDPRLLLELAHLVEDPQLRLAFDQSSAYYADRVRPHDLPVLEEAFDAEAGWFQRLRRWCTELPDVVLVVRHATGAVAGLMVFCPAERLPEWADECIEIGPMVRCATEAGHLDDSVFVHSIVFTDPSAQHGDDFAEMVQVGNSGALSRGLARHHRVAYVTDHERRPGDGSEFLGYEEVESLRRVDGDRKLFTLRRDFGPGGVVGTVCAIIGLEQQADELEVEQLGADLVAALRTFHDDLALRSSPLGPDPDAVRAVVRASIAGAFDDDDASERLLRDSLLRTYVDPDGGHATARKELHMSRSSFYRHLQRARNRLAVQGPIAP